MLRYIHRYINLIFKTRVWITLHLLFIFIISSQLRFKCVCFYYLPKLNVFNHNFLKSLFLIYSYNKCVHFLIYWGLNNTQIVTILKRLLLWYSWLRLYHRQLGSYWNVLLPTIHDYILHDINCCNIWDLTSAGFFNQSYLSLKIFWSRSHSIDICLIHHLRTYFSTLFRNVTAPQSFGFDIGEVLKTSDVISYG